MRRQRAHFYAGGGGVAPELLPNGSFAAGAAGWTGDGAALSIVNGQLRVTATGTAKSCAARSIPTVIGKKYRIALKVTQQTGTPSLRVGGLSNAIDTFNSGTLSSGVYSFLFTATAATTFISLAVASGTAGIFDDFSNVSVKAA